MFVLPKVEIKECNSMIDGQNFFHQPVKNAMKTYGIIPKITTAQGDDYTAGYLQDYSYFKENFKLIAIDLSKDYCFIPIPK